MTKLSTKDQLQPSDTACEDRVEQTINSLIQAQTAATGPQNNPNQANEVLDQLASVFAAYNETTNHMRQSHQQLHSEVARLREELEQKNEQLERKNRLAALGQMAAGMAHEIRNPLGGMRLYASLLERDLTEQPDSLKWVRKISKGVHTLDSIVSDILAFTQDQSCNKAEVNFVGLITEVLDYLQPQITACQGTIDLEKVDKHLVMQVDLNMMRRILLNLVRNALDALEQTGTVTIGATRCDDNSQYQARIMISDTGNGIEPEVMKKMFNPFFTTKDTGTGLGLTIVHQLVECHGGVMTVSNNDTRGATFTILLP